MSYVYEKQANFLTKPDKRYNLEAFGNAKKGKNNIMLVGGYSGGGKSTVTNKLKNDFHANVVELDDLKRMAYDTFDPKRTGTYPKYQKLMKEYIQHNPGLKDRMTAYGYNTEYKRFVQFMKDYAKKHPSEKIIMEGVQALGDKDMDIPRYLVGTGAFESSRRAKKRAESIPKTLHYNHPLELNLRLHNKISKERKALNLAETLKKIERSDLTPGSKRFAMNVVKHPAAASLAGGAALGGLGLAGVGAASLLKNRSKKKDEKVAMYQVGIYKDAATQLGLTDQLSQKALGKITKTKSVTDDMLKKYNKKQVGTMYKINGIENLIKQQAKKSM
jgi:hypothetical protein